MSEDNTKHGNKKLKAVVDKLAIVCFCYYFLIFPLFVIAFPRIGKDEHPDLKVFFNWSFGIGVLFLLPSVLWLVLRYWMNLGKKYPFILTDKFKVLVAFGMAIYFYTAHFFLR